MIYCKIECMAFATNRKFCGRHWVNIYEEWEVAFWLKEFDCSRYQLEKAVSEVGTSAEKVNNYLRSNSLPQQELPEKHHFIHNKMKLMASLFSAAPKMK